LVLALHEQQFLCPPYDLDVGADAAGWGEQERTAGVGGRKPLEVGGEQVMHPADRIGAADGPRPPPGHVDVPAPITERGELRREHILADNSSRRPLSAPRT